MNKRPIIGGLEFDLSVEGDGPLRVFFTGTTGLDKDRPTTLDLEITADSPGTRYREGDLGMVVKPGRYLMKVLVPALWKGHVVAIQPHVEPWSLLDDMAKAADS